MAVQLYVTLYKSQIADKSPYPVAPGDLISFQFNITDITSIASDGNLNTILMLDGEDVSSTGLTGSTTLSGTSAIVSDTLAAGLSPGSDYVLSVYGTIDGQVRLGGKIVLMVRDVGEPQ